MRVLITGVNGFVGSHLADFLFSKGYEVQGISRSDSSPTKDRKIFVGDLLDSEFVNKVIKESKPDLIFHLASFAVPGQSFENPGEVIANDVKLTVNLLEAAKRTLDGKVKILLVGSAYEYGLVSESENPIKEENPLRPINPYSVSKLTQDFLGFEYHLAFKMHIVRVRPSNQIGIGQSEDFVVPAFAKQIAEIEKKGKGEIKVGNLDAIRDFTDVRDMVEAYELAILKGKSGEVYNLGSGKGWSIRDVLDKMLTFSKAKIEIVVDPTKVRTIDVPKMVMDASAFRSLTGWKPKIEIEKSLETILNYWRANV